MSAEIKYRVLVPKRGLREYSLRELKWLCRTAQLPHNLEFQNKKGQWQPIEQLLEPLIEEENRQWAARQKPRPAQTGWVRPSSRRWTWAGGAFAIVLLAFPLLRGVYRQQIAAKTEKTSASDREKSERKDDLISSKQVVPGMTADDVIRAWGQPRRRMLSPD